MANEELQEVEASSPGWLRHVLRVAKHFWHNHKLLAAVLLPLLATVGAPVWLIGAAETIFLYLGHAHTVHKHGSRIWRYRGCLKVVLIVLLILIVIVLALFGFGIYWVLSMLFH